MPMEHLVPVHRQASGNQQAWTPEALLLAVYTPLLAFVEWRDHPGFGFVAEAVQNLHGWPQYGVVLSSAVQREPLAFHLDSVTPFEVASQLARALRSANITKFRKVPDVYGDVGLLMANDDKTGLSLRMLYVYNLERDAFLLRFDVIGAW